MRSNARGRCNPPRTQVNMITKVSRDSLLRIDLVLFDVDDTLVNVASGLEYGVRRTLAQMGIDYSSELETRLLDSVTKRIGVEKRLYEIRVLLGLRDVFGRNPFRTLEFAARTLVWLNEVRSFLCQPVPGASETLAFLKENGYKVGVVSDMTASKFRLMSSRIQLLRNLDVYVTRSDVSATKPSPQGILLALNRLGVPPERAAYVGNFPSDVVAGKNAGTHTIFIPGRLASYFELKGIHPPADFTLGSLRELSGLLTKSKELN